VKTATCVEWGYTGDIYCALCDKLLETGTSILAKGHTYVGIVIKEPGENEDGIKTYYCTTCGDSYTETVARITPIVTEQETETKTQQTVQQPAEQKVTAPLSSAKKDKTSGNGKVDHSSSDNKQRNSTTEQTTTREVHNETELPVIVEEIVEAESEDGVKKIEEVTETMEEDTAAVEGSETAGGAQTAEEGTQEIVNENTGHTAGIIALLVGCLALLGGGVTWRLRTEKKGKN